MIKWTAVLLIIAVVGMQSVYSRNLPSFLRTCKRKDPNLGECMEKFMETIMERSANGIPEINFPPTEPFSIPQIVLDQGASTAIKMTATFNDMDVYGTSKIDFMGAKAIMEEEPSFEFGYSIPTVRILSDYNIDGNVMIVPVKGEGKCQMNLTDVSGIVKYRTKFVVRKGNKYLDLEKPDVEVNLKNVRFYFGNLFNGNKQLGETTNAFINENWQLLYKELIPVIEDTIGSILGYVMKIVFDAYTYNELFPEK